MASLRQVTSIAVNTETTILSADAANFLDIYGITLANRSATDVDVTIKDATGGTTVWRWAIKAGTTFGFMRDRKQGEAQSLKNNNWTATVSAAITALEVTVHAVQRQ